MCVSHTHVGNHPICTGISTTWPQLFHRRSGYPATTISTALTKGTRQRQTNTQARRYPTAPYPPAGTWINTLYSDPQTPPSLTHPLKVLGDPANWNLKPGNKRESFSQQQNKTETSMTEYLNETNLWHSINICHWRLPSFLIFGSVAFWFKPYFWLHLIKETSCLSFFC